MSNRRTFAVLGVSEINSIFLAKQIAKTNPVLLFDRDVVVLNIVYSQILSEYPNANAEMMICPNNASWEADVIILSNAAATDGNLIEKIRNVATGKIVLFLENKKNTNIRGNSVEKWQDLFPYSKVVQGLESADNSNDSFFLNGNDKEVLKTILTLLTSIGFKANIV
jgi:predicted dinucleotide-binding enzyme